MRAASEDNSTFSLGTSVAGVELLPGRWRDSPLDTPPTEPTELSIFTMFFLDLDDLK
jgi:hypothetical protein